MLWDFGTVSYSDTNSEKIILVSGHQLVILTSSAPFLFLFVIKSSFRMSPCSFRRSTWSIAERILALFWRLTDYLYFCFISGDI